MSSKKHKHPDLVTALDREMRRASAQSVLFSNAVAGQLGMNLTDLECLDLLNLNGPVTAGRLAELTGLTTGAVTGLVDRLERVGYVRRERDPNDRRKVIVRVEVEEAGRKIGPLFAPMARAMDDVFAGYGVEEIKLILDFTSKCNEVVREEIARLRNEAPVEGEHGGGVNRTDSADASSGGGSMGEGVDRPSQ